MKKLIISIILIISPILAQCDWNEDDTIDIIDITSMVDCILFDCFDGTQCDWTGDGAMNIVDIVETVDCILNDCAVFGCMDIESFNFNSDANIQCFDCCEYEAILYFGMVDPIPGTIEIWLDAPGPVAGFQFNISGLTINGASAGAAGSTSGWQVATSSGIVIGFVFGEDYLPAGNYLLTILTFSEIVGFDVCISDVIISAPPGGGSYPVIDENCLIYCCEPEPACTDPEACNFNPDSMYDDGSCYYPVGCNDWCLYDEGEALENDCFGECGGSASMNECGCVGGSTGLDSDWCYGCTDPDANNFDPLAIIDDGSCE
ncbi:MAG: hypothetical protein HQ510_12135 [Candidatus Marinimicrobia bacterium]|nr:hypothetical protein [Candidatus Neomarinimicrobiota bacterium]